MIFLAPSHLIICAKSRRPTSSGRLGLAESGRHARMQACTHTRTHAHACTHAHTQARAHAHTQAYERMRTRAHMWTDTHTSTNIHTHIHTHTRTHTHTQTLEWFRLGSCSDAVVSAGLSSWSVVTECFSRREKENMHHFAMILILNGTLRNLIQKQCRDGCSTNQYACLLTGRQSSVLLRHMK